MAGEKRSYDGAAAGTSKLAKGSGSADVASSKAKHGLSRTNVPPKGQDVEGNAYWELSKMRRVGISHFRNNTLINIREYYDSAGQMRPGKKGISLSLEQYKALVRAIPDINATLQADGVAVSDAEDDGAGAAGEGGPAKQKTDKADKAEKKAKAPKKSNIEATSDEDSD